MGSEGGKEQAEFSTLFDETNDITKVTRMAVNVRYIDGLEIVQESLENQGRTGHRILHREARFETCVLQIKKMVG